MGLQLSEILEKYTLGKKIYKHKDIKIYFAKSNKGKQNVAIQIIHNKSQNIEFMNNFWQQYDKLQSLKSPHIVNILENAKTTDDHLVAIWERKEGILLTEYLTKQLSVFEIVTCALQLSAALKTLQDNQINTLALHPGNIIYTTERKFLTGCFGIFTEFSEIEKYMPFPAEQLRDNTHYSLGIFLYQLLTKAILFPKNMDLFREKYFSYLQPKTPWEKKVYDILIDIINVCLKCVEVNNISFEDIVSQICSLWQVCEQQRHSNDIKKNTKKDVLFGGHTLDKILGEGSGGIVYKAYDIEMNREVAIKVLRQKSSNEKTIVRFKREAMAIAKFSHPHIIKLYNVGEQDGTPYFSMEYINGLTLEEYCKKNELEPKEVATLFCKILQALHYIHRKKVIHRDLKPSNILIDTNGRPYVMDFGVAKIDSVSYNITQSGDLVGTIHYMSPEQIKGKQKNIDFRTDIYSIGVMLYQVLTTELPFKGKSPIHIMRNIHLGKPIHPTKFNAQIPAALEMVCLKAMAKNAKDRYSSAFQMARHLENISEEQHQKIYVNLATKFLFSLKTLSLVLIICLAITYFYYKTNENTIIENTFSFLDYELETYLENKLNVDVGEQNFSTYCDLFLIKVALKKYAEAEKLYNKITDRRIPKSENVMLAMAKVYYHSENIKQARFVLDEIIRTTKKEYIFAESFYYIGLINYSQKNFQQAQENFEKVLSIQSNFPWSSQLLLYLAICYKELQLPQKAEPILEKISQASQDVKIWEYLGLCYLPKKLDIEIPFDEEKIKKAYDCFSKCIAMEPENTMYHLYFAQTLIYLEKYREAYKHIETSLALKYDNIAALNTILYLSYREPSLQKESFFLQRQIINISMTAIEPDLFQSYFFDLEKNYYENYVQKKTAEKNSSSPDIFITPLLEKNITKELLESLIQGLISIRYQDTLNNHLINAANNRTSLPEVKERLQKIQKRIQSFSLYETKLSTHYQIAHCYNQIKKNPQSRYFFYKQIDVEDVKKVFVDMNVNLLLKYAAAKVLVEVFEWNMLKEMCSNFSDERLKSIHNIIAVCALREVSYPEDIPYLEIINLLKDINKNKVAISSQEKTFFKCLLAKNIYIYSNNQVESPEGNSQNVEILELLFNDKDYLVKLCAASSIFSLLNPNVELHSLSRKMLIAEMHNDSPIIRAYSHYYFWNTNYIFKNFTRYASYFAMGLEDPDNHVKDIVVSYALRFAKNMDPFHSALLKIAYDNINNPLAIKTVYTLSQLNPQDPEIIKIQASDKNPDFIRVYVFIATKYFYILHHIKNDPFTFLRNLGELVQRKDRILDYENNNFKAFVYFSVASLGFDGVEFIDQEENLMIKANLISHFKLIDQGIPFIRNALKRTSRQDKLLVAKKYLNHSYIDLRKAAISSYIFLLEDKKKLDQIYSQLITSQNKKELQGASEGYYNLFYNEILESMGFDYNYETFLEEENYFLYIKLLQAKVKKLLASDRKKLNLYIEWLTNAIKLYKKDYYFYELACIYQERREFDKVLYNLQKAMEYAPNNGLYKHHYAKFLVDTYTLDSEMKEKVVKELELASSNTKYIGLIAEIASLYVRLEEWEKAEKLYQRIFILNPYALHYLLDWVRLFIKNGNHGKASTVLQKLLLQNKRNELNYFDSGFKINKDFIINDPHLKVLWAKYKWLQDWYSN